MAVAAAAAKVVKQCGELRRVALHAAAGGMKRTGGSVGKGTAAQHGKCSAALPPRLLTRQLLQPSRRAGLRLPAA